MNCRYEGRLKLHTGEVVKIFDQNTAKKINEEFVWLNETASHKSSQYAIRVVQALFAVKLADKYGWKTDRIASLLKDVSRGADAISNIEEEDVTISAEFDYLRDEYGIDIRDDGMIRVEHRINDMFYSTGEWRPIQDRKPDEKGTYLITTDRGAVCTAHWHGAEFSGAAGKHAVAWRELPEPWEFWKEKDE